MNAVEKDNEQPKRPWKERREEAIQKIRNFAKGWDSKNHFYAYNLTHDLKMHSFMQEQKDIRKALEYLADKPDFVFEDESKYQIVKPNKPDYVFEDIWGQKCRIIITGKDFSYNRVEAVGKSMWSKNESFQFLFEHVDKTYRPPREKMPAKIIIIDGTTYKIAA